MLGSACRRFDAGLVAGSGGLVRLPRRIPPAIALEYALTGERMDAPVASIVGDWSTGLRLQVDHWKARCTLARLHHCQRTLVGCNDQTDHGVSRSGWRQEEIWARQRPLVESVLASDDAKEGARAFAEKRPPKCLNRTPT